MGKARRKLCGSWTRKPTTHVVAHKSIKKSLCPRELEPADRRTSIHVNLVKRVEDYQEPVKRPSPSRVLGEPWAVDLRPMTVQHQSLLFKSPKLLPDPLA